MYLFDVFQIIFSRDNIRNHVTMPDGITFYIDLSLIQVHFSIPFSRKIILILPPGNTRHKMRNIPPITPGFYPFFKWNFSGFVGRVPPCSIYHDSICTVVNCRTPFSGTLKGRLYRISFLGGRCERCQQQ
ncbi:hypothetical protein D3C71_736590 [compost metagenome]